MDSIKLSMSRGTFVTVLNIAAVLLFAYKYMHAQAYQHHSPTRVKRVRDRVRKLYLKSDNVKNNISSHIKRMIVADKRMHIYMVQ